MKTRWRFVTVACGCLLAPGLFVDQPAPSSAGLALAFANPAGHTCVGLPVCSPFSSAGLREHPRRHTASRCWRWLGHKPHHWHSGSCHFLDLCHKYLSRLKTVPFHRNLRKIVAVFIRHVTGILKGIALNTKTSRRKRGGALRQGKLSNPWTQCFSRLRLQVSLFKS